MGRIIDMRLRLQSGHRAKYAAIVRNSRNRAEIAARGHQSATILPWPSVLEQVGDSHAQPSGEAIQMQDRDVPEPALDA